MCVCVVSSTQLKKEEWKRVWLRKEAPDVCHPRDPLYKKFVRGAGSKSMFLHRLELGVLVFSPGLHTQERTPVNLQT